jgi:hypothetical protein
MSKLVSKKEYDRLMRKYVRGISYHDSEFEERISDYRSKQLDYLKENPTTDHANHFEYSYLNYVTVKSYYAKYSHQKPIVQALIAYSKAREYVLICHGKMPLSTQLTSTLSFCDSNSKDRIMDDLIVGSNKYNRKLATMKYSRKFLELGHNVYFDNIVED